MELHENHDLTEVPHWASESLAQLVRELGRFDPRKPATFEHRIKESMDRSLRQVSPEQFKAGLQELLSAMQGKKQIRRAENEMRMAVREAKRAASKSDRRYSRILKLMRRADESVPYAVAAYLPTFRLQEHLRRMCEPFDALDQARRKSGEVRAKAAVRAVGEVGEVVYKPYLRFLMFLCNVTDKKPRGGGSLGQMVKFLSERLKKHPGLVNPDAGWMRNASAHGHWKYLPGKDSVEMWDQRIQPRAVPVRQLVRIVDRMYQIAGPALFHCIVVYMFRDYLLKSGGLRVLLSETPHLLSGDHEHQVKANDRLDAWFEQEFGPTRAFFSTSAAGGT